MAHDLICDGCGATLPHADSEGRITCIACGRSSRDPGHRPPPAPTTVFEPRAPIVVDMSGLDMSGAANAAVKTTKWGCGIGSIVTLIIFLAIGGVVYSAVRSTTDGVKSFTDAFSSSSSSQLYPDGNSTFVIPGGESGDVELLSYVSDSGDDSRRKVVRISMTGSDTEQKWASASFPKDVYTVTMATSGNDLWIGAGDEIHLLALDTGKERWTTTLSDKVTTGCPGCFAVVDGKLIVRTDDAYLSAYGTGGAEPLWTKRLGSIGSRPSVVGKDLVVVDQETGKDPITSLLDPTTGAPRRSDTLSCPPTDQLPWSVEMSTGSQIRGVPGTGDLVSVFGFGNTCVMRWEAATGTVRWATHTESLSPSSETKILVSAADLVYPSSAGLVRVDLANGNASVLAPVPDANASPQTIIGRTLIADTTTTRGTAKGGLAAWNLDDGRNLWSVPLPSGAQPVSDGPYRSSDVLFDGQNRSVFVPPPAAGQPAKVVTFEGEGRTYRIQPLDLATGALGAATTEEFPTRHGGSGTVSLTVIDVAPNRLVVTVDSLLEVIPLDGGTIQRWPD